MCKGGCLLATCICQSCVGPNRMVARYIYGILFLFTNILAWMVRDYSHKALSSFSNLSDCGGEANCIGSEGVLRLSLGCFVSSFWSSMNFSVQLLICSIHDGTLSRDFLRVSGLICLGDKMWNLGRSLTKPI
jgi:hypothetical protein